MFFVYVLFIIPGGLRKSKKNLPENAIPATKKLPQEHRRLCGSFGILGTFRIGQQAQLNQPGRCGSAWRWVGITPETPGMTSSGLT